MKSSRTKQYDLFSVSKILSFRSSDSEEAGNTATKFVTVNVAVSGGNRKNQFLAVYSSNDYIVLRHASENLEPRVVFLPWFSKNPSKKVVAMDFEPEGNELAVVTADSTLYLIDINKMLKLNSPFDNENGHVYIDPLSNIAVSNSLTLRNFLETSATRIPSLSCVAANACDYAQFEDSKLQTNKISHDFPNNMEVFETGNSHQSAISSCIWWKSWSGISFIIIASLDGVISFTNRQTKEKCILKMKSAVSKVELMVNEKRKWKMLFIHTLEDPYYKLVIEKSDSDGCVIYPNQVGRAPFIPRIFRRFLPGCELSVYYLPQGPVIGVFDASVDRLELYDVDLELETTATFPLFMYHLGHAKLHYFTERFIFSVHNDRDKQIIHVISNLLALNATKPKRRNEKTAQFRDWDTELTNPKVDENSLFQKISIGGNEDSNSFSSEILGIFPAFCYNQRGDENSDPFGESSQHYGEFYIWTATSIYICHRSSTTPQQIFHDLVNQGLEHSDAEPFGKTLGLDLHNLYEEAADAAFANCNFERSIELYRFSNVRISKLLRKIVEIGRIDLITDILKSLIRSTSRPKFRSAFLNLLLCCYLQQLETTLDLPHNIVNNSISGNSEAVLSDLAHGVAGESHSLLLEEVVYLIEANASYFTIQVVAQRLFLGGHVDLLLRLAHKRGEMEMCFDALVLHGYLQLTASDFGFLCARGYSNLLLSLASGKVLFSMLAPFQQLEIILFDLIPFNDSVPVERERNVSNSSIETAESQTVVYPKSERHLVPIMHARILDPLIDKFDEASLIRLAQFLDPQKGLGYQLGIIYNSESNPDKGTSISSASSSTEFVEIYLKSLAQIQVVREKSSNLDSNLLFSQDDFLQSLKMLHGQYLPARFLSICFKQLNYDGAALIYELERDYIAVFECWIKKYSNLLDNNRIDCNVLDWYDSFFSKCKVLWPFMNSYADQAFSLSLLCKFWEHYNLNVAKLESVLFEISLYLPLAFILFNDSAITRPYVSDLGKCIEPCSIRFSSKLKLNVSRKVVEIVQNNSTTGKVDKDRLWTEILRNTGRDVNKRSALVLPSVSHIPDLKSNGGKFVAFTCGHIYSYLHFVSLLSELKTRLLKLPIPLTITSKFILADYSQKLINLSCPLCLYNSLLQEQIHRVPDYNQYLYTKWE